ncbi:unnamed protein product [Staurois parvus]|uniref:Uncharacterized protein n=1 Tax=Staurois parvus TaxID=386267 RepID=A0ABN9H770_9NEOB|nr:unnamed protein product [Staurois parvus]
MTSPRCGETEGGNSSWSRSSLLLKRLDKAHDAGTSGTRGPCTDRYSTPLLPSKRTGRPSWNLAS